VLDGPTGWIGREVFGSSGDLGIRRDGTYATHLAVEAEAVVDKPRTISWEEAAGSACPLSPRWKDCAAPAPKPDETVLVMGVTARSGSGGADRELARRARHRCRAQARALRRLRQFEGRGDRCLGHDVAARVRELTGGRGADIVFNTVGDPYFEAARQSLALRGRQILIAAVGRIVQFDILEFYRGQHTYVGIDTLGLSSVATLRSCGNWFRDLRAAISNRFPIKANAIYPLEQAKAAFVAVAGSSRDRVILRAGLTGANSCPLPASSCSPAS